jgi:hypothetical protein
MNTRASLILGVALALYAGPALAEEGGDFDLPVDVSIDVVTDRSAVGESFELTVDPSRHRDRDEVNVLGVPDTDRDRDREGDHDGEGFEDGDHERDMEHDLEGDIEHDVERDMESDLEDIDTVGDDLSDHVDDDNDGDD